MCASIVFALVSSSAPARADSPQTDLVLSGAQSIEITSSNANACYFDSDNVFNGQLTDPVSGQIISINVLGTVGDHPAKASDGHAQLTMLGFDTTQDDPFINWAATGGTVTLDDIDTHVALDDGSASTHGALGRIESDLVATLEPYISRDHSPATSRAEGVSLRCQTVKRSYAAPNGRRRRRVCTPRPDRVTPTGKAC